MEDSPAKKAGFERADVIIEYDGKPMDSPTHLRNAVAQTPIGKKVSVKLIRDKKPKTIELTIVEQPKSMSQNGEEESGNQRRRRDALGSRCPRVERRVGGRYGLKSSERGVVVFGSSPEARRRKWVSARAIIVLEVNRKAVGSLKSYEQAASGLAKDQAVLLLLKRKGQTIYLTLRP